MNSKSLRDSSARVSPEPFAVCVSRYLLFRFVSANHKIVLFGSKQTIYSILFVSTAALIAYSVYEWAEKEHHHLGRKNPKDFENDV